MIRDRKHYRRVYETAEVAEEAELELADGICADLGDLVGFVDNPEQSWYKFEKEDVPVVRKSKGGEESTTYLSRYSSVVNGLKSVNQTRIYVSKKNWKEAQERIKARLTDRKEV